MGWDGNLGRERLKLKSHRRLGKNGTFRKETCLQEDVTEAVLLWERNKLESLSEADPRGYYMPCTSTWTLSCQRQPTEFSMMMEMFCFLLSNMVATTTYGYFA